MDFPIIVERMKKLREKRNLTQKEMASKLEIKTETYSRYERGLINPPIKNLVDFATITNSSLDYIVGLEKRTNLYIDDLPDSKQNLILEIVADIRKEHEETKK